MLKLDELVGVYRVLDSPNLRYVMVGVIAVFFVSGRAIR